MNTVHARSREVFGGFLAEYRLSHWGRYRAVKKEDGTDQIFPVDKDAEIAAHRALTAAIFSEIRAERCETSTARSKAEALFGKFFPGKGRRAVEVVRR